MAPRVYEWRHSFFDSVGEAEFTQFKIQECIAGETLVRWHIQLWAESWNPIPISGQPLRGMQWYAGFFDGPWSSWIADHHLAPAESTYRFLYTGRTQWELEEHTLESYKFERWLSPRGALEIDIKAQRKIKNTGDGLWISGWLPPLGSSFNPVGFVIHGNSSALFLSPP